MATEIKYTGQRNTWRSADFLTREKRIKPAKVKTQVGEIIYPLMIKGCGYKVDVQPIVIFSMKSPETGERVYYTTLNHARENLKKRLIRKDCEIVPWVNVNSDFGRGLKVFIKNVVFEQRAIKLKPTQAIRITEVRRQSCSGNIIDFETEVAKG